MKKVLLAIGFILGISFNIICQVTGVKYIIEYNDFMKMYDCKIVITEGEAIDYIDRIQFNSQYTIVVPHGTILSVQAIYNPKVLNQFYTGTMACNWELGPKEIAPPITPDLDYYSVFPELSPFCAFDNLFVGDTIRLFGIIANVDPCENTIRPFDNNSDPSSIDLPGGGDFRNGYTIGNNQTYIGNLSSDYTKNYITKNDSLSICDGGCETLKPRIRCIEDDLIYEWSTGETTEEIEICPESPTSYHLLIKDNSDIVIDSLNVFVDFELIEMDQVEICENEHTVARASIAGGFWSIDSPAVATIDPNTGVITGIDAGETTILYTLPTGCTTTSELLSVIPIPEIVMTGEERICAGETSSFSSNMNGVWNSSDPSIATISEDGIVEGIDRGVVSISLTADNGCSSESLEIEILKPPTGEISGPDTICPGETTQLPYVSGGIWRQSYVSQTFVATIDNSGNVTGIFEGKVVYAYADFWGVCDTVYSDTIYVVAGPEVSFIGDDRLCIGETSSVSPNTGGTWESSDPSVASIDPHSGEIIGLAQGITQFTFTDASTGCSTRTSGLIVDPVPSVSVYEDSICINSTTEVVPSTGGVWTSLTPDIATVEGNIVTGNAFGDAVLSYTSDATGCTSHPLIISVGTNQSSFLTGSDRICVGSTTSIEPSGGGLWSSSDDAIATFDEDGNIIGLEAGEVTFTYIGEDSICMVNPTQSITVDELPSISISASEVCIYEGLSLTPTFGNWESNNHEIAEYSHSGKVDLLAPGITTFTYTSQATGCSATTEPITVFPLAFELDSPFEICMGETSNLSIDVTGTWESMNPSVATVDISTGLITAVSQGYTLISFTDELSNCISELEVIVNEIPYINYGGLTDLCVGDTSTLTTTSAGSWVSNDPSVASIDNSGLVTGLNPGLVTFTFTRNDDGCSRETGEIYVLPPSSPYCLVGTEEVEESKIALYPNPASDRVFIESESSIESVSMYTIDYRKINVSLLSEGSNRIQIITNDLTQGLYYVAIESEDKVIHKKNHHRMKTDEVSSLKKYKLSKPLKMKKTNFCFTVLLLYSSESRSSDNRGRILNRI